MVAHVARERGVGLTHNQELQRAETTAIIEDTPSDRAKLFAEIRTG